ncbi:YbdD/YjiX family protein [Microtetraspora sp. NBRC 16547]|uniref:YbdD/YjiX family protein n=1 Tax=Microtetraspora sp. NBRC 16547 TaxID=3030993 RepID=UPI00249FDF1D|nr:YbdD/YjiX family protein [Microtetraspora sp. NBRC 16547]GLW96637.1 hypothetical protein Misp02_07240 [Microtetraspora sp. NBRC 16547]
MNEKTGAASPGLQRAGAALRHTLRMIGWIGWYVKEVVGENDYQHYVAHLRKHHPEVEPMSRRDFERAKIDRMEADPKSRCC